MSDTGPSRDPWVAFSRIVAGVLLYGLVGFGLDRWWGTSFMVAIGIVIGAGLGIFAVARAANAVDDEDRRRDADRDANEG